MKNLPAAQHLAVLRKHDLQRTWQSLDDQRVCMICHRQFTGRDDRVAENGDGTEKVHCPTESCPSTPADWFYYGSSHVSPRSSSEEAPRKVEIDLNFF